MSEFDSESQSSGEYQILDSNQRNLSIVEAGPSCSRSVSCPGSEEYRKYETLLALNKMYDSKLEQLQKILQSRLLECRRRLIEIKENKSKNKGYDKKEMFNYVRCGRPYFKHGINKVAPDNEDTILMRESHMYDFSKMTSVRGWTVNDKTQFVNLILKMSRDIKKKELYSVIDKLKALKVKSNDRKMVMLRREIDVVGKMDLKDVALSLDEEYDWEYVANKLKHRHTVLEYRALWKLFLHPTINKNPWSKSEHTSLQRRAFDEKLQNWNKIASLLGTGRTGYQCFVYFRINMSYTFTSKKWTKEEEEYLKRVIDYYKEENYIPWGKVAVAMANRTKIQVYNKYLRLTELRKGRFLKEEDAVILTCFETFGANFKKMAKFLPGRSMTQCRVRFQLLTKKRVSTVWAIEEDRKLVQLMANQDLSANYSSITNFFPGKTRQNIRSRYLTLTKWMSRHPNVDIAKAPRRPCHRLGYGHSSKDLSNAVEELKSTIQSEVKEKIKSKHIDISSPEGDIDDAIVALLVNEDTKLEESIKYGAADASVDDSDADIKPNELSYNLRNLRSILILFRAKLDKDKFIRSPYAKKYMSLLEPDLELLPKSRSYSKKTPGSNRKLNLTSDIWGNRHLEPLNYVFPPNYSTITACKNIMSFISSKAKKNMKSVNIKFEGETLLLMERFHTLFLWPLLLASCAPEEIMTLNMQNNVKHNSLKRFKPNPEE